MQTTTIVGIARVANGSRSTVKTFQGRGPRKLTQGEASLRSSFRRSDARSHRAAATLTGSFAKTSTSRLPARRRRLNIDNPCERQLLGQVGRQRGEPAALAVAAG